MSNDSQRRTVHRAVWATSALFCLLAFANLLNGEVGAIVRQEPLDLDINLVAAHRLVHGEAIYDGAASRARAVEIGGPSMRGAYTRPTNSFVGTPATAMLHVPFLALDHDRAAGAFRLAALVGMIGALALTARAVEEGSRLPAAALGASVLIASFAMTATLQLGQGHELVMLGLAAAIYGTASHRWRLAGAGIAVATILKISPVLLLVYLVARLGRRARGEALVGFLVTTFSLVVGAAALGRPADLWIWARDVAPGLSAGIVRTVNQSIPGFVSRLANGELGSTAPLGPIRFLAVAGALGALVLLHRSRRSHPVDPMELAVLVLVGLVLGPLGWMHYATWASIPLVLLADPRRWPGGDVRGRTAGLIVVVASGLLLTLHVGGEAPSTTAGIVERFTSTPYLLAELLLLAVCAHRFLPDGAPESEATPPLERTGSPPMERL